MAKKLKSKKCVSTKSSGYTKNKKNILETLGFKDQKNPACTARSSQQTG